LSAGTHYHATLTLIHGSIPTTDEETLTTAALVVAGGAIMMIGGLVIAVGAVLFYGERRKSESTPQF
jgi:hypothetical protein